MDRQTVRVQWVDPHSIDCWEDIASISHSITIVESYGFEIHRDDEITIIAANIDLSAEKVSCTMVIPNECIRDYEYIDIEK